MNLMHNMFCMLVIMGRFMGLIVMLLISFFDMSCFIAMR